MSAHEYACPSHPTHSECVWLEWWSLYGWAQAEPKGEKLDKKNWQTSHTAIKNIPQLQSNHPQPAHGWGMNSTQPWTHLRRRTKRNRKKEHNRITSKPFSTLKNTMGPTPQHRRQHDTVPYLSQVITNISNQIPIKSGPTNNRNAQVWNVIFPEHQCLRSLPKSPYLSLFGHLGSRHDCWPAREDYWHRTLPNIDSR